MRFSLVVAAAAPLLLVLFVFLAGCEEKQGELVTCARSWSCDDNVVSTDDDVFCTDPEDEARNGQIGTYQREFAETCDGVNVGCGGGVLATCAAVCTAGGTCPIDEAVNLRL